MFNYNSYIYSMLFDNKQNRYQNDGFNIVTIWDFINEYSGKDSGQTGNLDIVTGYFTIRALSKLNNEIPEEDTFRIVSSELVKSKEEESHIIDLLSGDPGIGTRLIIDKYAEDAKAFLRRNTVQVRAIVSAFCHAKAYMFRNNNPRNDSYYLTGSSNLTDAGLGLKASSNIELSIGAPVKLSDNDYKEVCSWFEEIWKAGVEDLPIDPDNPKSERVNVKDYFIKKIDEYFRKYTPEEIYYKILFELFNSDIELDSSIEHNKDMSLLQTSVIWKTLFNYQQKGVISLIKMLRKYNGAILADAVGLGKTFSALAVIKYFQTQSYMTVVLCPKKLQENWEQYLRRRGSRFEKDEFDYVVRFHTDLQNERLEQYPDAKLSYLQNRKKILIVIDESHNLRNEKSNRYQDLLTSLIQNQTDVEGRDVKVLMLSATPINTGLNDVKGQFNLIGQGLDDAFNNSDFEIESLRNLFADCQRKYTQWCRKEDRTIGEFISMLPPRFFNLTDKLIVARTRKLIEKTLGEDLGFPQKAKPENVYQGVEHFGNYHSTEEIYRAFEDLHLTAYQPSLYIPEKIKFAKKGAATDWDNNVNREHFLVKMMGFLFMKRLESSWYSCMLTVKNVLDVHEQTLKLVLDYKENKHNGTIPAGGVIDEEDEQMEEQFSLRKGEIRLSEMKNLGGFEFGLRKDINKLRTIYNNLMDFDTKYRNGEEQDLKLEKLVNILNGKKNVSNKKVVIFTAYSDTAKFLFDELRKRGFTRMCSVSGKKICTTGNHPTHHFNAVLQSFAPYSKLYRELDWTNMYEDAKLDYANYYNAEKQRWEVDYEKWHELVQEHRTSVAQQLADGIDILIATDCLSEGQNLQDADMQINYDIHWNPVRLIQRFGRIDRIGSPNAEVQCVNFWPAKSFEDYLHLEERVMNRMAIMNLAGSETQELNENYQQMVADNTLIDKNADRLLQELQNNSISDIESQRTLSLKDFSFEVYRQDLIDYFEQHRELFRKMPNGIFSGFKLEADQSEHIPESLVAVVGYPHREPGSGDAYSELFLMCQPVDASQPATYQELNRAEVLEFLRQHKQQARFVPEWIETTDNERLAKLTDILKQWMRLKAPQQAVVERRNRFHSKGKTSKKNAAEQSLNEKFQLENFDLIVWEYVTK